MRADADDRTPATKRPRYCNFFSCDNSSCEGLCYNHHAHRDSPQVIDSEIETIVCGEKCLKEYCKVPSCRCFWKLQNEIASGRERSHKICEKLKKKVQNLEAEVSVLRASRNTVEKPSFSEEVNSSFGHHFHMLKNLEKQIRYDFCKTLFRYERDREQAIEEVEKLKRENADIKSQNLRLERESQSFTKIVGEGNLRPKHVHI